MKKLKRPSLLWKDQLWTEAGGVGRGAWADSQPLLGRPGSPVPPPTFTHASQPWRGSCRAGCSGGGNTEKTAQAQPSTLTCTKLTGRPVPKRPPGAIPCPSPGVSLYFLKEGHEPMSSCAASASVQSASDAPASLFPGHPRP